MTQANSNSAALPSPMLVLSIDTCGPAGSVAFCRLSGEEIEILSQVDLEGRTYSSTLVAAISDVLRGKGLALAQVDCIVVVNGPGSFTGVRVSLSAAKGLAEGAGIAVVAVSRLQVLALKAGTATAALDAHRHEIFLRLKGRELLAGAGELASLTPPADIAVCDPDAVALLEASWPGAQLRLSAAPTAVDAIRLAVPLIRSSQFADVALLDGHYLRRSDAEIFGDPAAAAARHA